MTKIDEQEYLKTERKKYKNIKSHRRKVRSLKEKYRKMQIIRISNEGKGTDGGDRIIKPTIDKTFSELRKHLSCQLKRFTTSQKRPMKIIKKKTFIFTCILVNRSKFLR